MSGSLNLKRTIIISAVCACAAAGPAAAQYDSGVVKKGPSQFSALSGGDVYTSDNGSLKVDLQVTQENSIFSKTVMVKLANLNAAEVEPFVRKSLSIYGSVSVNSQTNMLVITDREPKLSDVLQFVKKMDELGMENFTQFDTEVIRLANVQASNIVNIIGKRLTGDGSVQADDNLNVLIVTDVRGKIEIIKDIIKALDEQPQQVIIEAQIVQVSDSDFSDVGIDLAALLNQGIISFNTEKMSQKDWGQTAPRVISARVKDTSLSAANYANRVVNILVGTGRAKVLATPRIVTLNNKTGTVKIESGGYYISSTEPTPIFPGMELTATPHIGSGDLMNIQLKISAGAALLPSSNTVDPAAPANSPNRVVDSTIVMRNGETFVVGGLEFEYENSVRRKTPLLGQIPFLGGFFSEKIKYKNGTKVLFFITPRLIENNSNQPTNEEEALTEE